mgnify:CR=1 FL=1
MTFLQGQIMKRIITQDALKQRIRRRLRADGEMLVTNRSPSVAADLGHYMVIDASRNIPSVTGMSLYDLVDLGFQIGAVQSFEAVRFEDGTIIEVEEATE